MKRHKMAELLRIIRQMRERPTGSHLSDEDFVAFILEEMTPEQEAQIDAHLATCAACTHEIDTYFAKIEEFPAQEWAQQRPAFEQQLRAHLVEAGLLPPTQAATTVPPAPTRTPLAELRDKLRTFLNLLSYPLFAPAFDTRNEPFDLASNDGLFGVFIEDVEGAIIVSVDAQEPALAGVVLHFTAGPWQRNVQLERVAADQAGAKVVITRQELETFPSDAQLSIQLLSDEGNTERTSG